MRNVLRHKSGERLLREGVLISSRRMMTFKVTPEITRKNYILAGSLLVFTGGVYYHAINKIKATDELSELEQAEDKVNLHESGLKITPKKAPRSVHDVLVRDTSSSEKGESK